VIQLVQTARSIGDFRFARELAVHWLSLYPGDLAMRLAQAQVLMDEGRRKHAIPMIAELCEIDPEFRQAQEILAVCRAKADLSTAEEPAGSLVALGISPPEDIPLPEWTVNLWKARQELDAGLFERAERRVTELLSTHSAISLIAVTHLRVLEAAKEVPPVALQSMAEHYLDRWPKCLQLKLILASALMQGGEPEKAVALIHEAAAQDIVGQVPNRLWGKSHPYLSLWPNRLEASIEIAIPAGVAAAMGWNQLPDFTDQVTEYAKNRPAGRTDAGPGERSQPDASEAVEAFAQISKSQVNDGATEGERAADLDDPGEGAQRNTGIPETLRSVQAELERVAAKLRRPGIAGLDGRFPLYVIFSTRRGLEKKFGPDGARALESEMKSLVKTIQASQSWGGMLLLGDDPRTTSPLGIKPAPGDDPWALKLILRDLDSALRKRGEMIGALLIVGGPEVVPFHHLPNPVDDDDPHVPSDNPYGTRDENYFIPEWPVGRLPGGSGGDPTTLLQALRRITDAHSSRQEPQPWFRKWLELLFGWFWPDRETEKASFGYTAAIWRKASLTVFRPIGEARTLLASPPSVADHLSWNGMTPARLGYYNLHGLEDTSEWYGQRDPAVPFDGPDYPIALRTQDVLNSGKAPQLVFSEACFGGHIVGKSVDEALALKFIHAGTSAMIGCTCTAYGSIAPPLIAADMLGHSFWTHLQDGLPAGEALRRAKIHLAQEMDQRQGYLDGEDQKTLISFILYGDPLARPFPRKRRAKGKSVQRLQDPPNEVKTVCDRTREVDREEIVPEEVLTHVKRVVKQYLPGMADAQYRFSHERSSCDGDRHTCPTAQLEGKSRPDKPADRQVITLSKRVHKESVVHPHFARLTLDRTGKVVKLAVSR
jgi:hypothetical protein